MNENTQHAEALEKILLKSKHYEYKDDPESSLADLLTDLMHLADLLRLDFVEILGSADYHHAEDIKEQGGRASRRKQDWTPRGR